jgi:hypothetical protein
MLQLQLQLQLLELQQLRQQTLQEQGQPLQMQQSR